MGLSSKKARTDEIAAVPAQQHNDGPTADATARYEIKTARNISCTRLVALALELRATLLEGLIFSNAPCLDLKDYQRP
jgi:hypothetical protein